MSTAVLQSVLPNIAIKRGKVRDVYDFGDRLLFVATDRTSAFDWVLPNGIPDKGRVLTQLSNMWFERLDVPDHLLATNLNDFELPEGTDREALDGRSVIVRKTDVVPIECVVRGYLSGSGWKEYQHSGKVCGIQLPDGLVESDRLPEPIFTPATKAEEGHDENISFERMVELVGSDLSEKLRTLSLEIYTKGCEHAETKGIIIADTKMEFGMINGEVLLIDEVLTPDSSRFWPADLHEPGKGQPSFDKQIVRDWLLTTGWNKNSEPPAMPEDVIEKTRQRYIEVYEKLTGKSFSWA